MSFNVNKGELISSEKYVFTLHNVSCSLLPKSVPWKSAGLGTQPAFFYIKRESRGMCMPFSLLCRLISISAGAGISL